MMGKIQFDCNVAEALRSALHNCVGELYKFGDALRLPAEIAIMTLRGPYSKPVEDGFLIENGDRNKLRRVMLDLRDDVKNAISQAQDEEKRLKELAEWQEREDARQQKCENDPTACNDVAAERARDPKPTTPEVIPEQISAVFSARVRPRRGDTTSDSTVCGTPGELRTAATETRAQTFGLEQHLSALRNAWTSFVESCSWIPIGTQSFLRGFERWMEENDRDAEWLENIAAAFEKAGSGSSLSSASLNAAAGGSKLPRDVRRLLTPGISPDEAARLWDKVDLSDEEIKALPLHAQYALANRDGVPASKRDIASREVLQAAESNPDEVRRLMGVDMLPGAFKKQVQHVREGLDAAETHAMTLPVGKREVVQLLGFGVHDGSVVAPVGLGNLDTATNVMVNVTGAVNGVNKLSEKVEAAKNLYSSARKKDKHNSYAVVTWIGYNDPGVSQVSSSDKARSGGEELATFIDGAFASRTGNPPTNFVVAGHSYGSAVVSEALKLTEYQVDSAVHYGSAGVDPDWAADDYHADDVYWTEGDDWIANWGRTSTFGSRTDPKNVEGYKEFSSGPEGGLRGVGSHSMLNNGNGYMDPGTNSLDNMADILATGEPE